jgi:hypothetical protein
MDALGISYEVMGGRPIAAACSNCVLAMSPRSAASPRTRSTS